MLSVTVPGDVAVDLLEGPLGDTVAGYLAAIGTDVPIGAPVAASLLADNGPAGLAWEAVKTPDGMGWVTAGKLLARKRPALIPVYDRVVRCAYGRPKGFWRWLNDRFGEQDGALSTRLAEQREAAGMAADVTPLRVLDVIVWMRRCTQHRASRGPGVAW